MALCHLPETPHIKYYNLTLH